MPSPPIGLGAESGAPELGMTTTADAVPIGIGVQICTPAITAGIWTGFYEGSPR